MDKEKKEKLEERLLMAQIWKTEAEIAKISAETDKLIAETEKIRRDIKWYLLAIVSSVIATFAAIISIVKTFL